MSEAVAAHCDGPGCTKWAPITKASSHPDDWFVVFGPSGRLDFCTKACVSQYFRPWSGQQSVVAAGGFVGGGGLTIVGESGPEIVNLKAAP